MDSSFKKFDKWFLNFIRWLLVATIIAVPLIVHIRPIATAAEVRIRFPNYQFELDIFNWWKGAILHLLCIAMGTFYFLRSSYQKQKDINLYRTLIFAYFWLVTISAIASKYSVVVWHGMPNYLEGGVAIYCYGLLFLASMVAFDAVKYLDVALTIVTTIMISVCSVQFVNPDFFLSYPFNWLILGDLVGKMGVNFNKWPLYGTIMNPNMLGTFAALIYPYFLGRKKWIMTAFAVLIAVGSQSRGAWVAMLLTTIWLAVRSIGFKNRLSLIFPAIFFVIGILALQLHSQGKLHKVMLTDSGRFYMWKHSLQMMDSTMILGKGPAAFGLDFPQDDPEGKRKAGWAPTEIVDRPHNFYLQVWHASGLLSLLILLSLFGKFLRDCYLSRNPELLPISASVICYLIDVFFTDSCTSVAPIFWIILGTGAGMLRNSSKEKLP